MVSSHYIYALTENPETTEIEWKKKKRKEKR